MRTETEMQSTLQTLEKTFGVDVSDAKKMNGKELESWLENVEQALFNELAQKDEYDSPSL